MSEQITHKYHGQTITFDEKKEDWKVVMDNHEQHHKSLQVVKNYIDRRNKKKFNRIPVFINKGYSYYDSEGYDKAVITSIGVDETVFVVREGEKHASHCRTAFVRNAKNEKLIKKIADLCKARKKAGDDIDAAKRMLIQVDFEALIKKALDKKE